MTKYFAQDTPQASLERMMMSVPGFQRRGGGISFSNFHYKPEDVDCQYCLHYRRKSCQIPICPYIAERLASGALEYHDLVLECLGRHLRLRLYQRIRSVTHWDGPDQAILHKIRPYCQKAANRPQEDIPPVYWAALYLLASRESLWKTVVPALASGYIDFHCISCRGLAVRDYPIFYSAKRLYERKFPMDAGELASRSLIDDQDFLNILYATLIARYGKSVMDTEERTYNGGTALSPVQGGYACIVPPQTIPRVISTNGRNNIEAIKKYFCSEFLVQLVANHTGMDYDTLIGGEYKILLEPI